MLKSTLLGAIRTEMHRHNLDTFQNENNKTVTPGCPACGKVFYTVDQFCRFCLIGCLRGNNRETCP